MGQYVKRTNNPKMGRPKKEIDRTLFENLCNIQCTEIEIGAVMGVSWDTLNAWAKETYGVQTLLEAVKMVNTQGKVSLRRAQFKKAIHGCKGEGDSTMLIWLGKQYLGQTDKMEEQIEERVQIVADLDND